MIKPLALILMICAAPVFSDVSHALDEHILPGYDKLASRTAELAKTTEADCAPTAVIPDFHKSYDAWVSISHIQFGPIEDDGLSLAMAFWPDPKDQTGKSIARLTANADPIVDDPAIFHEVSVAAQGFTALERLLFEPQPDPAYACALTRAITHGLAQKAGSLQVDWQEFAVTLRSSGATGNARFQSEEEALRALYTALSTGLEFLHDQRLGRPLGTFDRPRPRRAEARRSQRSMRHISLSLAALEDLALLMVDGETRETSAAFADAQTRANELDDPALAGVAEPTKRFRVEALQRGVQDIRDAVNAEIGQPLGITAGFNALDGD